MRITFTDGTSKGFSDESIDNMSLESTVFKLNMKDEAVFIYPVSNIREIHYGGKSGKKGSDEHA